MNTLSIIRGQITPVADFDFFVNVGSPEFNYTDEQIAINIKGANYAKTQQRIADFTARCNQTLAGFRERVTQLESELSAAVETARSNTPGSGPSKFFLDKSSADSVASYNDKVARHNDQIDLHRQLVAKAQRVKERLEEATDKYNEKKADLEEQVCQKKEELTPALDQDILTFLDKIQQLAYDDIHNKKQLFEGFMVIFMAKKAYVFLYDRLSSISEKGLASDILKKLEDELSALFSGHETEIRSGLGEVPACLYQCYKDNETIVQSIRNDLKRLPYSVCNENEAKVSSLIDQPVVTAFSYEHIIDPAELAKIEQQVQEAKSLFQQLDKVITEFSESMSPTFELIEQIKSLGSENVAKMEANKTSRMGEPNSDLYFLLSIFNDEQQEQYLKKHKTWIKELKSEIEAKYNFDLDEFIAKTLATDLLVRPATDLLKDDKALGFLLNRHKLKSKREVCIQAVATLDNTLDKIGRLPKEKSEAFRAKVMKCLVISLIPAGNIVALFQIHSMVKEFLPALASKNSSYAGLKQTLIGKFRTFSIIHFVAMLLSGGLSFAVDAALRPVFYACSASFLISALSLFFRGNALEMLQQRDV